MAKNETRRIPPALLNADREAFDALQGITNYAPANQAYKVEAIQAKRDRMEELRRLEVQALATASAARDAATAGEWDYHNAVLGAKTQVEAQFGPNSDQYASLGNKKKSDYRSPSRRKKTGEPSA